MRPAVRVPVDSIACRVAVVAVAAVFVQRDHFLLSAAVSALHALLALPARTASAVAPRQAAVDSADLGVIRLLAAELVLNAPRVALVHTTKTRVLPHAHRAQQEHTAWPGVSPLAAAACVHLEATPILEAANPPTALSVLWDRISCLLVSRRALRPLL